jgi:hypothetical protein
VVVSVRFSLYVAMSCADQAQTSGTAVRVTLAEFI